MATSHHEKFFRFFPIPRSLEIKAMGLDISDNAVRVMDLAKTEFGYIPHAYSERKLKSSSISVNREEIRQALISLKKELGMTFVRAALPEEKAYQFKTEIPLVSPNEMREAVGYTIEENAPVSLNEIVYDYRVIGGLNHQDHIDVTVSVLPKILVDEYISLFYDAGITAISFEIEAQAIARAVMPLGDLNPSMVIHMGDTKTIVTIVSGGAVQFTTTLPLGGNSFSSILEETYGVNKEDAQKVKQDKDFIRNKEDENVHRVYHETLGMLKDEINKHYMYWVTHKNKDLNPTEKITAIYLSGRDSCMPGFADYMSANLNAEVKPASVWQNCFTTDDFIPKIERCDSFVYAPALGLILPK
jgi:type IV pilus assembly protein PilM